MYKQSFGSKNQVQFNNESEYYQFLGYLAKSDGSTSLVWEHNENQGAWGSEGRIQFYVAPPPLTCILNHTAGTGNIVSRVNCNEFVQHISTNHGFVMGPRQDVNAIRSTIPKQFIPDFESGLVL